jgi:transcription initiation factor TFIID subunit 9B
MDNLLFSQGYIVDVFQDAKVYSEHADKDKLDIEDVRLAIQSRVNHSFTQPPPREVCILKKNIIFKVQS